MAGVIEEDILRLQVTVDYVKHVQVLQGAQQFSGVESASVFIESALAL
jgi:predicted RNA-binding protein